MLIPYKQLFIQAHYQQGQLITEQNPGERNPLIQLGIDNTSRSRNYRSILPWLTNIRNDLWTRHFCDKLYLVTL